MSAKFPRGGGGGSKPVLSHPSIKFKKTNRTSNSEMKTRVHVNYNLTKRLIITQVHCRRNNFSYSSVVQCVKVYFHILSKQIDITLMCENT